MDTVDNSDRDGEERSESPFTERDRPLTHHQGRDPVLSPGDERSAHVPRRSGSDPSDADEGRRAAADDSGATTGSDGPKPSGHDLAQEALRAAQRAARARGRTPNETAGGGWRKSGGDRRRKRWSGAREDERDPQPLGRIAEKLVGEQGWRAPLTEASVFGRWPELVGADIAEHSTPVSLRDGELVVSASSTAWATQLRTLQRQLLARIAAGVGHGVVKRLKVQGPAAPSWRKGPRTVRGRGPRDTYG